MKHHVCRGGISLLFLFVSEQNLFGLNARPLLQPERGGTSPGQL